MNAVITQIKEAIAECDKHMNRPCGWDNRLGATAPEFRKYAERRLSLIHALEAVEGK